MVFVMSSVPTPTDVVPSPIAPTVTVTPSLTIISPDSEALRP